MTSLSRSFHRTYWACFLLVAGTLGAAGHWSYKGSLGETPAVFLPARLLDPTVRTPEEVKRKHLFVGSMGSVRAASPQGIGVGLRVLQNLDLFNSLFPGYEESLADRDVWNLYFREIFGDGNGVRSPLLMRLGAVNMTVQTSWAGSIDLYKRYGADILTFGASTTMIAVSAGLLRERLDGIGRPSLRNLKVLQCGGGGILPASYEPLAAFVDSGKKAQLLIWGYDVSYLHRSADYDMIMNDRVASYRKGQVDAFFGGSFLATYQFPRLSWTSVVGPGLQERLEGHIEDNSPALIPAETAGDPARLKELVDQRAAAFSISFVQKDCDLAERSAELDRALAEMLKFSGKVLLFIAPTAPVTRYYAPRCLMENLRTMLKSKAGPRVIVDAGDWDSFGLDYSDYLYPTRLKDMAYIDPFHPNPVATEKVTAKIARLTAQALTPY